MNLFIILLIFIIIKKVSKQSVSNVFPLVRNNNIVFVIINGQSFL